MAIAIGSILFAQSRSTILECRQTHRSFAPRNPKIGGNGNIIAGQQLVQLRFQINGNTSISVVEHPASDKDLDKYNSTLILRRNHEKQTYALAQLVKGGDVLRVVELACICTAPDRGVIYLAFEAGSTGAAEGFVAIPFSSQGVSAYGLPISYQGRIVVKRDHPGSVELWSASNASGIDCDACKKRYSVQDCKLGDRAVQCSARPATLIPASPMRFMKARIAIQQSAPALSPTGKIDSGYDQDRNTQR